MDWFKVLSGEDMGPEEIFFSKRDPNTKLVKRLTSGMVASAVKDTRTAKKEGLDSELYATHSLRVGGAEAMAQAGCSVEHINRVGRWAKGSLAAIGYRTPAVTEGGALSAIAPPLVFNQKESIGRATYDNRREGG